MPPPFTLHFLAPPPENRITFEVDDPKNTTIAELKEQYLENRINKISAESVLELTFCGDILANDRTVHSYQIDSESTVRVLLTEKGSNNDKKALNDKEDEPGKMEEE